MNFGCGKKRLYARAKWHFGDGRSYCSGCTELNPLCPFHKCRYTETTPQTVEGYQAWEVLLKLSEQNLETALKIAETLNFDKETLTELLSVGVFAMKQGLNDSNSEKLSIRLEVVGGDKVRSEFKSLGTDGQKAFRQITQVIQPANDNLLALSDTAKTFNGILRQTAGLVGAYLGASGLVRTFKGIVSINKEFESLSGSLKTVTGSAEGAKEAFASAPSDATILHTLELRHPSFVDASGKKTTNPDNLRDVLHAFKHDLAFQAFYEVSEPQDGDVVLMRQAKNPVHAGIWLDVDGGGVLHCVREIGVVFQDVPSLNLCGWFLHSYYRVKENT